MPVAAGQETRVLVAPSTMLGGEEARVVSLRHPRTREAASFLLEPATGALAELLAFQEEHRAWFLGQQVVADGRLLLATPVSPLLLVLPYLVAAERLVPLDQLLEDQDFPLAATLLAETKGLEAVAERKGAADLNVWKYSEERAAVWLEGRVGRVAKVLEEQAIDLTQGAVSHNYRQAGAAQPQTEDYLRCALGIVSEYLPAALATALEARLGLQQAQQETKGAKRMSVGGQKEGPKPKKVKQEGPSEDYSKAAVKAVVKEEQTAKQKALAASAKGTKSISSFFSKKT